MTQLPKIGKPATNALNNKNITTLEQVSTLTEKELSKMHGVGPKAIKILLENLEENGLSFYEEDGLFANLDFTVSGDLNCNNAPKRKDIRDILIASTIGDEKVLNDKLSDDFVWIVPGEVRIEGKENFIKEINEHLQKVSSLEVKSLITHGKEGASHGTITNEHGGEIHFADMYEFESHKKDSKVKTITSYVLMND